jgi:catechol 2,3-dioxygenase-like lactoylglutathione lyase family enzyme
MPRLLSAVPIGDEDLTALPVRTLAAAVAFYTARLGFRLAESDDTTATVVRDGVRLGLIIDPTHAPGRAGSLALEVDDLAALHAELARAGASPGEFGMDHWDGRAYRTFFVREEENGYCFCCYQSQ